MGRVRLHQIRKLKNLSFNHYCSPPYVDLTSHDFPGHRVFVETIATRQAIGRGEPPPEALTRISSIVQRLQETNHAMEIPKALCGRVSNVLVWEESHWEFIRQSAPVGTFLRLRNVDIRKWQNTPFRCKF
jgi:hypothetical protein